MHAKFVKENTEAFCIAFFVLKEILVDKLPLLIF